MRLSTRIFLSAFLFGTTPALAAADQVFSFHGGWFIVRSLDGRSNSDCGNNLACRDVLSENTGFLSFDLKDFNGPTIGADWFVGLGVYAEAGAGVSFYQRTVPTVYLDYVNANGSEIAQDLKLRIVPISAMFRLFPVGRNGGVQPYVGAGVTFFSWRYSEAGDFVDFNDGSIFRESFVDSGTKVGGLGLAGIRFAVSDGVLVGGEFRYQAARAELDPGLGFAGERLDLGGFSSLFTVQLRF